jgi:hypothetical protein
MTASLNKLYTIKTTRFIFYCSFTNPQRKINQQQVHTNCFKFEVPQFYSSMFRELQFVGYVAVSEITGAKFRWCIFGHSIPNLGSDLEVGKQDR